MTNDFFLIFCVIKNTVFERQLYFCSFDFQIIKDI